MSACFVVQDTRLYTVVDTVVLLMVLSLLLCWSVCVCAGVVSVVLCIVRDVFEECCLLIVVLCVVCALCLINGVVCGVWNGDCVGECVCVVYVEVELVLCVCVFGEFGYDMQMESQYVEVLI